MPTYNARRVTRPSRETLSELDKARLAEAGRRYDGNALTAEQRLVITEDEDDETWSGLNDPYLEVWEFDVDGKHTYTLWHYRVDSGTIFFADSALVFGDVIQFGFGGVGGSPDPVANELERAYNASRKPAAPPSKSTSAKSRAKKAPAAKRGAATKKAAVAKKAPAAKKAAATKRVPAVRKAPAPKKKRTR